MARRHRAPFIWEGTSVGKTMIFLCLVISDGCFGSAMSRSCGIQNMHEMGVSGIWRALTARRRGPLAARRPLGLTGHNAL